MAHENKAIAFIIESNRSIREVTSVKRSRNFYTVKLTGGGCGIQGKEGRLFVRREATEVAVPNK